MSTKSSLLVFEDPASANALKDILGEQYDATYIREPANILQKTADINPDIVLLNIDSPSGLENLRKLSQDDKGALVIATTEFCDEQTEVLALQTGAADCIKKPFSPTITALRIANCAERAQVRHLAFSQSSRTTKTPQTK